MQGARLTQSHALERPAEPRHPVSCLPKQATEPPQSGEQAVPVLTQSQEQGEEREVQSLRKRSLLTGWCSEVDRAQP